MIRVVLALLALAGCVRGTPQPSGKRDVLLWQLQLTPDQCPSNYSPCYNIYAINQTHGDLTWYAYTTSSSAIKGMSVGHHSVYYTTWTGPGLYTVNAATGHVRWQFPMDNWFRYWIKDIDLPPSASFHSAEEVKELVYVTTAGPPSRLYGLRTKSGARQWEFKSPVASAVLSDLAGPAYCAETRTRTVFLAYNLPGNSSSWLQALDISTGSSIWKSAVLNSTQIDRVELYGSRLLATTAAADAVLAFDSSNGSLLWRQPAQFCNTPSPLAYVHADQLLLSKSCSSLSELAVVDAVRGGTFWDRWQVPADAEPTGNCTWVSVKDGSIVFGCSCSIRLGRRGRGGASAAASSSSSRDHAQPLGVQRQLQGVQQATSSSSSRSIPAPTAAQHPQQQQRQPLDAASAAEANAAREGVCMYSVSMRSGKLQWVQALPGNASFPVGAQTWGMRPLLHQGLAVFMAETQVMAVDGYSGKLSWVLPLEAGEMLPAWQLPVLDPISNILLLTPQRQGPSNKTTVTAVSVLDGKLLWRKTMNGTAQPPRGPVAGAEQLWVSGGRVYVEACKGRTCCLRALNISTGKQKWGVCLEAEKGEDATHPHAQFAIWVITLVTIGSIGLLIVGACLLYVHRWSEERKILDGGDGNSSPRHTYRPLPEGDISDSDNDEAERYRVPMQGRRPAGRGGAGSSGAFMPPYVRRPVAPPPVPAAALQAGLQPPPAAAVFSSGGQQPMLAGQPRVGGRYIAGGAVVAAGAADLQGIDQHQEAQWVQERGAISVMPRPRVPADDEPVQPDSDES